MTIYNSEINRKRQRVTDEMTMETGAYFAPFHLHHMHLQNVQVYPQMIYYKLNEYRLEKSNQMQEHFKELIRLCCQMNCMMNIVYVIEHQTVSLYYGFEVNQHYQSVKEHLKHCFYDVSLTNQKPMTQHLSQYGGCIVGNYQQLSIDTLIQSLLPYDGVISLLMKGQPIEQERLRIQRKLNDYQPTQQITYAIQGYHYQNNDNALHDLVRVLQEKEAYLQDKNAPFVLCECYFSSSSFMTCQYYGQHLSSCFAKDHGQSYIIYTDRNPMQNQIFMSQSCFRCHKVDNSLSQLLSFQDASQLCIPPTLSFMGFDVYQPYKDETHQQPFDFKQPLFDQPAHLLIGYNQYQQPYFLPIEYLKQHVYVDGKPGFGKTYLVKTLIIELMKAGIDILVIESAKKEYCLLKDYIPHFKVYSAGLDALPLKINLFVPEKGTLISQHVSSIIGAFMSLFDGDSPLPEALTRYIYYLYQKHHIDMNMLAREDMDYPTIHDFLDGVDDFIQKHTTYESKVKGNLTSAIYTRVASLLEGPTGNIIDCQRGISIAQLMKQTTIIELDDIESDNRDFVIMILTNLINQYLRNQPLSSTLQKVLVIEEAHHILMNTQSNNLKATKVSASDSYSRLLSEIRAYGVGIMISDQRPSRISSDVIGNSRVKMTFNISEHQDIQAISQDYRLSPYQENQLSLLKNGEFLMNVGGYKEIVQLKCQNKTPSLNRHWGCLFVQDEYQQVDTQQIKNKAYILKRITYLDGQQLYQLIHQLCEVHHISQPICLLGQLLEETTLSDIQKRRILYSMYQEINHG